MAGDRTRFDEAMERGDSAAWDQDWPQAVEAYSIAVREFPQEINALNSLGFGLIQVGRLEDALKVYLQAMKVAPQDPIPVEKSADILERLGRLNEAAKQYVTVADLYLGQHDLKKAISNWEKVTQITPGLVRIHQKLAQAYERNGQRDEAVNEYLKLAYNFQQGGHAEYAQKSVERAYRLAPKDPDVLNAMTALRSGTQLSAAGKTSKANGKAKPVTEADDLSSQFGIDYAGVADANESGAIGDAVDHALELLAQHVFESGMMDMAGAQTMQAVEMHRAGIIDEAITAYRSALSAGMSLNAPLYLNLGALLLEKEDWDEAKSLFGKVNGDPELMNGVSHGLSLSYIGLRDWRNANTHLVETLKQADLSLAKDEEAREHLEKVYVKLNKLVSDATDQTLEALSHKFASMVTGVDWRRRVAQTRSQLEDMITRDPEHALSDLAQDDGVIEAMARIDDYIDQRRFNLAMDEAHEVILKSPGYLAAHLRVAKIMMDMSLVEQAIAKYNLIAQTYLVRGDEQKTADILNEVIKLAPSDIRLRENLIELLEQQGRHDEMVDQYVDLAGAYGEMADHTSARVTYDQAIKLAQRTNAPESKIVEIMHHLAEIDLNRMELRGALRTYHKIAEMVPEDETARLHLVDLNYRLNNSATGLQELDKLLQLYAKQRRPDMILDVLEAQVEDYPDDMGLRSRLGAVYQNMKRNDDAVEQFERLRQLQTDAGLHADARKTIKRIIGLNPPKVSHYQALLQQLGG